MKQQKLIDKINELFPKAKAVPMEEWDGSDEGIWFRGSEEVHSDCRSLTFMALVVTLRSTLFLPTQVGSTSHRMQAP